MKVEIRILAVLAAFYFPVAVLYWLLTGGGEPVGAVGLLLTGGLCLMISGYLAITARKLDARPDDDPEGEISDVEGEFGFFSPHSWWPLALAGAAALVFLGAAVGWWLVILGTPLLVMAVIGWTFEYYRGEDAV